MKQTNQRASNKPKYWRDKELVNMTRAELLEVVYHLVFSIDKERTDYSHEREVMDGLRKYLFGKWKTYCIGRITDMRYLSLLSMWLGGFIFGLIAAYYFF